MLFLSTMLPSKLVHTRRALSSAIINSDPELISGQACNPSDPPMVFSFFWAKEFYGTRYQSGSFSLINVGVVFHCLHSFSFSCRIKSLSL